MLSTAEEGTFSAKAVELLTKHVNSGLARLLSFMNLGAVELEAEGAYVTDSRGRRFIDFLGGYGVFNFGHRHPKIVSAVKAQLDKMPLSAKILVNGRQVELAGKLAEITPPGIEKFFFCNSGTEAVEGALKVARLATGKKKIIYAEEGFHGKTMGSLSATGRKRYRAPFEPLLPNFQQVRFGDAEELEKVIDDQTCAFIVEPIQGEGGIRIPYDGYLKDAREITRRYGALLIIDEVQTGFGRTGKNFACEYEKVEPDLIVLGKALSGGVVPIAAFGGTCEVWKKLEEDPLLHTSTFGGNPLACTAGISAVEVLLEERLAERAAQIGSTFLAKLKDTCSNYQPLVRDVRGRGLMIGIEFFSQDFAQLFITFLIEKGILTAFALNSPQVVRLEPPLNTPEQLFETVLTAIDESLGKTSSILKDKI